MLTADRHRLILEKLKEQGSVSNANLMEELEASESTIRRDISQLAKQGLCRRVHGGALVIDRPSSDRDDTVLLRKQRHREEKLSIARAAAALIEDGDLIYLDAGTTTELMVDFIRAKDLTFVTNAISHAKALGDRGFNCYILGGQFKSVTEAIVGEETTLSMSKYNFSKAFLGANGVDDRSGFTTPELKEAYVKKQAFLNSKKVFVLADASKFDLVTPVSFGDFQAAQILVAGALPEHYRAYPNVKEVKE